MAKKSMDEMLKKAEQPKAAENPAPADPVQKPEETHKEEVTVGTGESVQTGELPNDKPTETGQPPVELTDGASEKAKDNSETASEKPSEQPKAAEKKVVVVYVGGGTWRDEKGCAWANEDRGRIKKSRQYDKSEYDKRKDLQFMVKYKAMTATVVE